MSPLPDAIIPPDREEGEVSERAREVFRVCNRYLRAIIAGDRAEMDAAGKAWDEIAG